MGLRWYAAVDAVWASYDPDDLKAGPNPFEYGEDSPTNLVDPSGEDPPDTGPTPSTMELAWGLSSQPVSPADQVWIKAYEDGYGQSIGARLNYLTQQRKQLFEGYDPSKYDDVHNAQWLESLKIYDAELLECKKYSLVQAGLGSLAHFGIGMTSNSVPGTPSVTVPTLPGNYGTILNMALSAGSSPSQEQFDKAERFVNSVNGGNSRDAIEMVKEIRGQPGVPWDNQLLAALDHYFFARWLQENGVPAGFVLIINSGYIGWKLLHLPNPNPWGTNPYAPPSVLQWEAGNWGTSDGVERHPPIIVVK